MTNEPVIPPSSDPLERLIKPAHDRVDPNQWAPPRHGICPQFRLGKRWFNILWLLPVGFLLIVLGIAIARELRELPAVQEFIARYPGHLSTPVHYQGFPLWLRFQHAFNLLLMVFIIRSGLQILADHPRLYIDNNCTPGREWFRFQRAVPSAVLWTAKDDAVTIPGWIGLPGIRHSIGLARWWHFSCDLLWMANGIIFYALLFSTHQWERIVPTSLDVVPNAVSTALQYLSLQMPAEQGWVRYNCLQQLAYFITVFIAAPAAIFTGLLQSPAISNRLGWLGRTFNRQVARSLHFLILLWFLQFIVVHVTMVLITGARRNLNHITLGTDGTSPAGALLAALGLVVLAVLWFWASPFTMRNARLVQKTGRLIVGGFMDLMERWDPGVQYEEKDIATHLWPNGLVPESDVYKNLCANNFQDYRLRIGGLVKNPLELSYAELKALPKQEQITNHFCIQGWSGVAKWAGAPMREILDRVQPQEEAKYAVFYSFGEGGEGGMYYDVHKIENMRHKLTILAYEMNGQPLPILHGAPLRLRCENELGFKQVKWIQAIEFVADYSQIGSGQGGYNEDHEFYGYRVPI
jgi:DMSO/TMAO reductase YedYZ molybdopterin-dependent catalytic subunit/thiosulfate reductase cytochrome b subunit